MSLTDYSNPDVVYDRAKKLYGKDTLIKPSTRQNKKYMILDPYNNKWVHFGQMGYQDFSKHKNLIRREKFIIRNRSWALQDVYTPGFLSYVLLW